MARTDSQGDHVNPMNPAPETDFGCAIDPGQNPNALNDLHLTAILILQNLGVEHAPMSSMASLLRREAWRRGLRVFDALTKPNPETSSDLCTGPSAYARGCTNTALDPSSELVV